MFIWYSMSVGDGGDDVAGGSRRVFVGGICVGIKVI